jgi:hypothetical protein
MERNQLVYCSAFPWPYLGIGIAPQGKVSLHHFAELKTRLPRVGLIVQYLVKPLIQGVPPHIAAFHLQV